ncbi:MAG: RNA polymerase sigma factor [Acidimicrobiales bacterium]
MAVGDDPAGDLVLAARAGSTEAWTELIDRFSPMVRAVARRHRLGPADIDDVYQVTWLRLAENLDRLREPDRVAGWLATTAKREALRIATRPRNETTTIDLDLLEGDSDEADQQLAANEAAVAVARGFSELGERCRDLLTHLLIDELEYAEISDRLDIPIGSIGPTRKRCLQKLRALLLTNPLEAV